MNSRRAFMGSLALGASAGLSMITSPLEASLSSLNMNAPLEDVADVDKVLAKIGNMKHPVAYDVSQANAWGTIWTNVYYLTNEQTGTPANELGVMNVLRHHGILFSFKDDLIKEYQLGKIFGLNDPKTDAPTERNFLYNPEEGDLPNPMLQGNKVMAEKGVKFCTCNMAYQVYAGAVAQQVGKSQEDVYAEFVAHKHPGIDLAPSGVWVLGRLAEHGIAYIDASVG